MRNYAQLDDFISYDEREVWRSYIEEDVVPLWESAWRLHEFHSRLENEFDGRSLGSLRGDEQQLVLGGIAPRSDEVYRDRSLATFYKELFGVQLSDVQSWILAGEESDASVVDVTVEVETPQFIELVETVLDRLTAALSSQYLYQDYLEPDVDFRSLIEQPEELQELVETFYQQVLGFAVNHSYETFFVWSLNQVPRGFLEQAYPDVSFDASLMRDEFGLMSLEWNNPIESGTDVYAEYDILCFPEYNPEQQGTSFGGSICEVNEDIWGYFHDYDKESFRNAVDRFVNTAPDLKTEYWDRVENRVANVPDEWKQQDITIYYKNLSASTQSRSAAEQSSDSLMGLLDRVGPLLFLGLQEIRWVSDDSLRLNTRRN